MDIFNRVVKFNRDAGTLLSQEILPMKVWINEYDMILEELQELKDAFLKNDRKEMADALADIVYVTMGTMAKLGFNYHKIMNEVCLSNESKYFDDGLLHKNENGKILKGPNFKKPELEHYIDVTYFTE